MKVIASAGDAEGGKEGFRVDRWRGQAGIQHARTHGMGGRIEPAEPEPPPAHSLGKVGEDAMGRVGQFVRPCWLGVLVRHWW